MEKKKVIGVVVLAVVVLVLVFVFFDKGANEKVAGGGASSEKAVNNEVVKNEVVDFEKYNYDYVDEGVNGILDSMIAGKKVAFYLPSTGYVNVSRGEKFGVAFALRNPNPAGAGVNWDKYNDFEYSWSAIEESCGVGLDAAQGWIERGWGSWGKMAQGWIDHMTIYFAFPSVVEPCSVRYDFEVRRDGEVWGTKSVEFNLV